MSSSGTLSNYYVDSFLLHESEELVQSRYGSAPLGQPGRQASLEGHPEFAPCSFQSKASVFSTSWNAVHPPSANNVPAVYHPYVHHQAPMAAPDGRYMRSWLEPMPGSLSFAGLPASRHYGIKPEPLTARRGDCTTFDTHALSLTDFACGSPPVDRDKQASDGPFSENNGESEANGDKPQLDPSKSGPPSGKAPTRAGRDRVGGGRGAGAPGRRGAGGRAGSLQEQDRAPGLCGVAVAPAFLKGTRLGQSGRTAGGGEWRGASGACLAGWSLLEL